MLAMITNAQVFYCTVTCWKSDLVGSGVTIGIGRIPVQTHQVPGLT